jgi:TPP-dependent pyruvate/acetoin dehydrogenase alpha subunit
MSDERRQGEPQRLRRLAAMLRARRFDETLIAHAELVTGVFHVSIGQEGTAAALAAARAPADLIMLNHRNHGALAAIGSDLETMFREILGRDGGPQRGRAGSLHLADPANGVPYTSAMVAGGVALAVGLALAKRRLRRDGIVFAFCGDGAMGEGAMHESLNIASLWRLPLLVVCESNAAPVAERANAFQAARALTDIAAAHQVLAVTADADDARAIEAAMASAADAVRAGAGPRFIEARSEPWPGNRTFLPRLVTGELDLGDAAGPGAGWTAVDPILREARALHDDGVPAAAIAELDRAIRAEVRAAFERAAAAPAAPATLSLALAGVWAQP